MLKNLLPSMHNKIFLFSVLCLSVVLLPFFTQAQIRQVDVVVESLPDLSVNAIGVVPTNNVHLWSGTPTEELNNIFQELKKNKLTPAQRSFVAYLLSIDTTGVVLNNGSKTWGKTGFLYERLNVLKELGEFDLAIEIIGKIPKNDLTEDLSFLARELYLMKGDTNKACKPFFDSKSDIRKDKLQISCYLAKEEKDKAILAYDIFRETYPDKEQSYKTLADSALLDISGEIPSDLILTPLDVYLVSLIKNPKINWTIQSRAVKKTLTDLPTTDIVLRMELGEQIGLSFNELKRLYDMPLLNPDVNNKTVQRVMIYKQMIETTDEDVKIKLLKSFLNLVKQDKLLIPMAPLIAELLYPIEPDTEKTDLAFDAVQIYALTNNAAMAEPWYQLLQNESTEFYQKQFLKAIPFMYSLGGGYPYNLSELMDKFCWQDNNEDCEKLKQNLPVENYYQQNERSAEISFVWNLPSPEELNSRLGELFLKAIVNLSNEKFVKESTYFIKEFARPNEGSAILREGMVFE